MIALRLLPLVALMTLLPLRGGASVEESSGEALEPTTIEVAVPEVAPAPEPNATFLAGLGGLVLLFFVLRRK